MRLLLELSTRSAPLSFPLRFPFLLPPRQPQEKAKSISFRGLTFATAVVIDLTSDSSVLFLFFFVDVGVDLTLDRIAADLTLDKIAAVLT